MPYSYEISESEQVVVIRGTNHISLDDSLTLINEIASSQNFKREYKMLVDVRNMKNVPSPSEVKAFASALGQLRDKFQSSIAVVVAGELNFGMARMTSIYAELEQIRMRVFYDYEDACKWLSQSQA
jgi:hypothetical protein